MKLQSLALVFLVFAFAAAWADTALETGDANVDNHVDGELTEQELDREDNEPIQEDEDDDGENDMLVEMVSYVADTVLAVSLCRSRLGKPRRRPGAPAALP